MKKYLIALFAILLAAACRGQDTFAILGDSYSTFKGYVPEGFEVWYDLHSKARNDVCVVEQTWWYLLCERTGLELVFNNSYSGSTVCNSGYDGKDYSDRSFISRMPLTISSDEAVPDIIFVFGATNDSWADSPLGELKYSGWTDEDRYRTLPSYCFMLDYLKENAPGSRIINIINDGMKDGITEGIKAACSHYGMEYIELHDIDKGWGHPTIKGMEQICEAILEFL